MMDQPGWSSQVLLRDTLTIGCCRIQLPRGLQSLTDISHILSIFRQLFLKKEILKMKDNAAIQQQRRFRRYMDGFNFKFCECNTINRPGRKTVFAIVSGS